MYWFAFYIWFVKLRIMNKELVNLAYGLKFDGFWKPELEDVFSTDALKFIRVLDQKFGAERKQLLLERKLRNENWYKQKPEFPKLTQSIREGDWKVAPVPDDLQDRRVEITGPVDRKMIINALNSGAKVFMADFEDSNAPSWANIVFGQLNLFQAVRGTIELIDEARGKEYRLNSETATLMVRPRGLHLEEKHFICDDQAVSASLFDFGLYFFNNAQALVDKGSGPYFYLPKIEYYLEAAWWNEVFEFSEAYLNLKPGTIKATVLIETINASFQLDEILYALREHSAGLNCGRWDYLFSYIKRFKDHPDYLFPDRDSLTMETDFMRAYSRRLIQVCHKRGVHAMGGMAAQIPIKNDPAANEVAYAKVRADKLREVQDGHDGTWVAHPALVPVALEIFNEYMPESNQIAKQFPEYQIAAEDLIAKPQGAVTEAGLRKNISVGIQYLAAWLSGQGAAAINHLMEDAATAEISRAQVWQCLHRQVQLSDGRDLTRDLFERFYHEELSLLETEINPQWKNRLRTAARSFHQMVTAPELKEFLTTELYHTLT